MAEKWIDFMILHWPFIGWALCAMVIGRVMVTRVFTQEAAEWTPHPWRFFFRWGRRTLPLHPMLAGVVIGFFWPNPEPSVQGQAAMLYFATSGALSLWLFEVLRRVAKGYGVTVTLPGGLQK